MSNIFYMIQLLPRTIRDIILDNVIALIRTTAPVVADEEMKNEIEESIEIYQYCVKCGEHARLLSSLSFCHGCVEYGYTRDINGNPVPPYSKLPAGVAVGGNNLFGNDDDYILMII